MYQYRAVVVRVVDGDTVRLAADLGFRVTVTESFRLAGINTPERGEPGWGEATGFLRELLAEGREVVIRSEKAVGKDKYGRWLAHVYLLDGVEQSVNEALVASGHAVAWDGRGARPGPAS